MTIESRHFLWTLLINFKTQCRFVVIFAVVGFISFEAARAASSSSVDPVQRELVLGVGTQASLATPGSLPINISDGRILRAEERGSTLRITGRKIGAAVVATASQSWNVTVLSDPQYQTYRKLRRQLSGMRGLDIGVSNGRVVVRGRLLRVSDWKKIADVVGPDADYRFLAEPDPLIQPEVETMLAELLKSSGLPPLDWSLRPAVVRLDSNGSEISAHLRTVLAPFGFEIEKSPNALTLEPLVRVQILVTELRKTEMRRLGIQWPDFAQAQLLPIVRAPGHSLSPLSVQINALEDNGAARILASPNLLCRSGKEAQFLAGGELPIKITSSKRQDVIWKRYGVLLRIKPKADFGGRMSIGLETEVSTIDSAHTVDGLPGLLTNRIESHFDLHRSQTIALSGLIKRESGSSSTGLPGLSQIPILGTLFSSHDFRDQKTELVVFVTPEVITLGNHR